MSKADPDSVIRDRIEEWYADIREVCPELSENEARKLAKEFTSEQYKAMFEKRPEDLAKVWDRHCQDARKARRE